MCCDVLPQVVDAPEVLTAIDQTPSLGPFLNTLYKCQYRQFFAAFNDIITQIKRDPYLAGHVRYYMREVRVVVYTQVRVWMPHVQQRLCACPLAHGEWLAMNTTM